MLACSESQPTVVHQNQTTSVAIEDAGQAQGEIVTQNTTVCANILQNFDSKFKFAVGDDNPAIPVASEGSALTENEVRTKLLDFARVVFGDLNCDMAKIKFRSVATQGEYFEGSVAKSDFVLLKDAKISEPEFLRRLTLLNVATLESIQLRLAQARESGDSELALKLVNSWLEKVPDSALAKIFKGNILLDREDNAAAATLFQEALSALPYHFIAWYNLAYAKNEMGDSATAIAIFNKLLNPQVHFDNVLLTADDINLALADSYLRSGDFTRADTALAKVSTPDLAPVILLKASVKRQQKDFAGAKIILESYLAQNPDDTTALYDLLLIDLDLHDASSARQTYGTLKNLNADMTLEFSVLPFLKGTHE